MAKPINFCWLFCFRHRHECLLEIIYNEKLVHQNEIIRSVKYDDHMKKRDQEINLLLNLNCHMVNTRYR